MANEIIFKLASKDADNLWGLVSAAKISDLHTDPGVPFAVYELRVTLADLRQEPDEEMLYIHTPQGLVATAERRAYCKKNDLTLEYFPKILQWKIQRRLLVILKLVLKDAIKVQTGESFDALFKLCGTLRLTGWFLKTFKRPVSIELEDDCEMDDEQVEEDVDESVSEEDNNEAVAADD